MIPVPADTSVVLAETDVLNHDTSMVPAEADVPMYEETNDLPDLETVNNDDRALRGTMLQWLKKQISYQSLSLESPTGRQSHPFGAQTMFFQERERKHQRGIVYIPLQICLITRAFLLHIEAYQRFKMDYSYAE